ncbi:MAG: nuclear transport factor 2 family protein [Pyrinomonadaceae bacterium]|nr:nuclear transport factor 2 family protein [Pyrinomonadaceae bacterium]
MKIVSKFFLLVIFAFTLNAFGQKTDNTKPADAKNPAECASDSCEVLRAEREYNEGFTSPTFEFVDKVHTDDFFTTSENPAQMTSKAVILNYLKNFGTRTGAVITVNTLDLKVRLYGQTAVATGIWKTTAQSQKGTPVNKSERFTRVWVKENARWRLAASHYSTAFEPPIQ